MDDLIAVWRHPKSFADDIQIEVRHVRSFCDTFPREGVVDPRAYLEAIKTFSPGSCVTIFTPDDTHFEIALACINHGLHVLVTKPAVKTLEHHQVADDFTPKIEQMI